MCIRDSCCTALFTRMFPLHPFCIRVCGVFLRPWCVTLFGWSRLVPVRQGKPLRPEVLHAEWERWPVYLACARRRSCFCRQRETLHPNELYPIYMRYSKQDMRCFHLYEMLQQDGSIKTFHVSFLSFYVFNEDKPLRLNVRTQVNQRRKFRHDRVTCFHLEI